MTITLLPWVRAVALHAATLLLALSPLTAAAHEGHDHGPPPPPLPTTVKPRVAIHTDSYELVAILKGATLSIFLDRYATNEPVPDATLTVMSGGDTAAARPIPDGTYRVDLPRLATAGRHELIFTVSHPLGDDLLAGEIETGAAVAAAAATSVPGAGRAGAVAWRSWLPITLALAAGVVLGMLVRRRPAVSVLLIAGLMTVPGPLHAHEGHDLSPAPASESLSGDIPRRLPDGSVFLPKPSQRLLSVRSEIAVSGEVGRSTKLVGRIVADPNRSGLVQSISGGRISAPERGLPVLGQVVRKGETLAMVTPALPLADQSTLIEKQRELEGARLLAQQRLSRLSRLGSASTPRAQIEDIEQEIANLDQRLASLKAAKISPEALEAPIDGIVSMSRAVSGQVVQAQDVLFQIVDPASLWVEALLFDPLDPAGIDEASASMPDGKVVQLAYRGRGRAVQAQGALIQFAMQAPPPSALIGLPVTVHARTAQRSAGILLPRDAVVRGPGGETIVWQHLDPERFVVRPVRVESYDGARVVITAGIAAKDRIVVHAAELISQVR